MNILTRPFDVDKSNPVLNGTQDPSKVKEYSNRRLNEKTKKQKHLQIYYEGK